MSKTNYTLHTEAIKDHIIPVSNYSKNTEWLLYAEEADLLNVALFNCTAKDWREANPNHSKKDLNIRDFASINELVVLSNLENINALLIEKGMVKIDRVKELERISYKQLNTLNSDDLIKNLKRENETTYVDAQNKKK